MANRRGYQPELISPSQAEMKQRWIDFFRREPLNRSTPPAGKKKATHSSNPTRDLFELLGRLFVGPGPQEEAPTGPSIGPMTGAQRFIPVGLRREMQEENRPAGIFNKIAQNFSVGDIDAPIAGAGSGLLSIYRGKSWNTLADAMADLGESYLDLVHHVVKPAFGIETSRQIVGAKKIFDEWVAAKKPFSQAITDLKSLGVDVDDHNFNMQQLGNFYYDSGWTQKMAEAQQNAAKAKKEVAQKPINEFFGPEPTKDLSQLGGELKQAKRLPRQLNIPGERGERAKELGFDTPAFHATGVSEIFEEKSPFMWGSHFGTEQAALDRLRHLGYIGQEESDGPLYLGFKAFEQGGKPRTMAVMLRSREKFAEVADLGGWDFDNVLHELKHRTIINKEEHDALWDAIKRVSGMFPGNVGGKRKVDQAATKVLGTWLREKKGIYGFRYENRAEDVGSESYVVFDPADIRSVFANYEKDKSNIADLMAGIAMASLGIGAASRQKESK